MTGLTTRQPEDIRIGDIVRVLPGVPGRVVVGIEQHRRTRQFTIHFTGGPHERAFLRPQSTLWVEQGTNQQGDT